MRARRVLAGTVAVAALAFTGVASASITARSSSGPLTASFTAPTHTPNCKQKWPVTVAATWSGHPAHASAYYQFVFQGQVVSTQYPYGNTSKNPHGHVWSFYKSFYDNTFGPFGSNAVGQTLVVRAVVRDGKYAAYPSLWVKVQNASGCHASH